MATTQTFEQRKRPKIAVNDIDFDPPYPRIK